MLIWSEKMIVYGNRYRSSYEEIDIALTKAEELFRRGKYKRIFGFIYEEYKLYR